MNKNQYLKEILSNVKTIAVVGASSKADNYEVDDYERVKAKLKSGIKSWIYVDKK